jgi:hypothetical protein
MQERAYEKEREEVAIIILCIKCSVHVQILEIFLDSLPLPSSLFPNSCETDVNRVSLSKCEREALIAAGFVGMDRYALA